MRNFRRFAVTFLAILLVLASMTTVFAADPATIANADKAATLKDLGLYAGINPSDVSAGLGSALTTQDSLIFLARLFGYNEDANALTAEQVAESLAKFDDVASISEYAKKVVAYSAANGILSGSTKDGKFFVGAKDTVTAARFASFMLKQMGYVVADYTQAVAQLAETRGSKFDARITGDLTRDNAVAMMYATLTAEKVSGRTIVADIVGDNAELKAKAEKLGLIGPGPDLASSLISKSSGSNSSGSNSYKLLLKVESVKALNTKQVEIKFNLPLNKDSAQNQANYEIKDMGSVEKTLTNNSCKLGADMKTVTITLDSTVEDCLTNSSKAKVIVSKNITATNGYKLRADKEVEVEVQDGLIPIVKEVKSTGERHIRITFSEPVYEGNSTKILSTGNFAVKSGTYTYYVQKAELNLDVINIEVGTKLVEGPVTVTVNNAGVRDNAIKDYAGNNVFKGEHTFYYIKDISVPGVTVKSAKGNRVVLNFSKLVQGSNIRLYHSEKGNEVYMSEATTTGYVDEITFVFDKLLPTGTLDLFLVSSETIDEKLIDSYGIKVPDQQLICDVAIDTDAPVVTDCKENKNESIKIEFDEELDADVAANPESYVVKKLSNNEEIPLSAAIDDSMKSVELKFSAKLEDNTEYQLLIKKFKDIYGNTNASDYKYIFATLDFASPEVNDGDESDEPCYAVPEKGKIFIVYSEAMNEAQMLDKANYQVSINERNTYNNLGVDDTITKVSDRIVQIYVKELEGKNDSTIIPYVRIAPIMDLAGKRLYASVDYYTVKRIVLEYVCIEEAQLIAKNKIKVEFNKKMESISESDIELTNLTTPGSIKVSFCESTTVNSNGRTEVVLILDNDLATDLRNEAGEWIGITTIDNPSSESESGSKLESEFYTILYDKTAPEIVMWNHPQDNVYLLPQNTTGIITLYFSEDIEESKLEEGTFNVTGFRITGITAPSGTKTVVLEVMPITDNTPINTTVTQTLEIYDADDNALDGGSAWEVAVEIIEPT